MKAWLLVEQGLHRGARVCLQSAHADAAAARFSVGSGADDDILLTDDGVAPGHLVLLLSGNGLVVQVAGPGVRQHGHDTALAPGDSLHLTAPMLRGNGQTLHLGDVQLGLLDDAAALGLEQGGAERSLGGNPWQLTPVWAAGASIVAVLLVLGAGIWPHGGNPGSPAPALASAGSGAGPEAQTQLASRAGWSQLRVVSLPDGRTELRGAVQDRGLLQQALHLPAFASQEPVVRVLVHEEVIRHVRQVVPDTAVSLVMHNPPSAEALPALELTGITRKAGIPAAVALLKKEWEGRVEIIDRTSYVPESGKQLTLRLELPVRITAVNVAEGYVEGANGVKYFVGSAIRPQQTVESISNERVVFNVAGKRIDFVLP
jgi:hypothetical protein